jgi:hypothetical protein
MQILRKTHTKTLELDSPISYSIDEIIESLEPNSTFIVIDLFLYTITKGFETINFHLIINRKCVSYISFDVQIKLIKEAHTKEIYQTVLKDNFNTHLEELTKLQDLIAR